jgi:hypothetical protein
VRARQRYGPQGRTNSRQVRRELRNLSDQPLSLQVLPPHFGVDVANGNPSAPGANAEDALVVGPPPNDPTCVQSFRVVPRLRPATADEDDLLRTDIQHERPRTLAISKPPSTTSTELQDLDV